MSNVTSLLEARVRAKAKVLGLNEHQIQTILEGAPAWTNVFLDDAKIPDRQAALDKVIIPFNTMKLDYDIIKRIDAGDHTVMCVAGEEGFAYTIGLTNNRPSPHELYISVGIGSVAQSMLNEIAGEYPDGNYPTEPIELKSCFIKKGNRKFDSRVKIVKSTAPEKIIEDNFRRIDQWTGILPTDIYIVYVADINNILPGEEGYDINFKQLVEEKE